MDKETTDWLKELAKEKTWLDEREAGEDVVIDDYAGGNVDDAYWKGHADGQTAMARVILTRMKLI